MSTDNDNDALEQENQGNGSSRVAMASPPPNNLDSAMAALIRAARPSGGLPSTNPFDALKRAEAQSSPESAKPAEAPAEEASTTTSSYSKPTLNNLFGEDDSAPATPAAAPVNAAPAPSPVAAALAQAAAQFSPTPSAVPAPQPAAPAPAPTLSVPAAEPTPVTQSAVAIAPETAPESAEGGEYLSDASKYIADWLADNYDNEDVVSAAMDWARKHGNAEHNGYVIAQLLTLEGTDNELTLWAVRWITQHSTHDMAREIVNGLKQR